eukprot:TRINITY_DN1725_c0_g1_i1.p2 TRINITY_DN1725_c0_g1~~TRINITY_DN1725_c0_g1_i1.p2  ORF type:complete len:681 (-),score=66.70 TRINITY_DN1725_c0_g1_i1:4247-6289(-)
MFNVCVKFCQQNAEKLKGMRENLLMHLLMLTEYRLLSTDELYKTMAEFDKLQGDMAVPDNSAKNQYNHLLHNLIYNILITDYKMSLQFKVWVRNKIRTNQKDTSTEAYDNEQNVKNAEMAEKILMAQMLRGVHSKRQPVMTAGKLKELDQYREKHSYSLNSNYTPSIVPDIETCEEYGSVQEKGNLGKLLNNKKKIAEMAPPQICRGYKELIQGLTPARMEHLISGRAKDKLALGINASYTFEYPPEKVEYRLDLKRTASKKICSPAVSVSLPRKPELLEEEYECKCKESSKKDKWVLIIDHRNKGSVRSSMKFLYNLTHLYTKYKLDTPKVRESREIRQRAYQELLELCSYYLSKGKITYSALCIPNGKQLSDEDIAQVSFKHSILVAVTEDETFMGLSEDEIQMLHSFIKTSMICKKLTVPRQFPKKEGVKSAVAGSPLGHAKRIRFTNNRTGSISTPLDGTSLKLPIICSTRTKAMINTRSLKVRLNKLKEKYKFSKEIYYELLSQYTCLLQIDSLQRIKGAVHDSCIQLSTFKRYTTFLNGKPDSTVEKLLKACDGICKCGKVSLEGYVKVHLILQYDDDTDIKEECVNFWAKLLNPKNKDIIQWEKLGETLETMGRSTYDSNESSSLSIAYAKRVLSIIKQYGCVDNAGNVFMGKFKESIKKGLIDPYSLREGLF